MCCLFFVSLFLYCFVSCFLFFVLCCTFYVVYVLFLANLQHFWYEGFSGLWQEKADRWSVSLEHLAFCTRGSCVNAYLFSLEMTYSESAEVELFV